jgi:multiple sugar transport system ATP-binding protein
MNLIPTVVDGAAIVFGSARIPLDPAVTAQVTALGSPNVTVGIRPQGLAPAASGVPAKVVVVEELGSETFIFAELEHRGEMVRLRIRVDAEVHVTRGDQLYLDTPGPVHVFGPDGPRLTTSSEEQA